MPDLPRRAPGNQQTPPPLAWRRSGRREERLESPNCADFHLSRLLRWSSWSSSRELGVNSQEFAGPIFLPGVLLEQAPFSMVLYLLFKKCYPWLFITTMPFLYFLLLHPEAKEKNRIQQRVGSPYIIAGHSLVPPKLQKGSFIRKSLRDPSKFLREGRARAG